jgi:ParB/RepB/Spo0J family partition protein
MNIDIRLIRPDPQGIRTVDKKSPKYQEIVSTVPTMGILNPPNARKKEENGQIYYQLVDGHHRWTACVELGLTEMPIHVLDSSFDNDTKVMIAQIVGNLARVETKPIQFSKQLSRILAANPTMTIMDLAKMSGFSTAFIQDRLSLKKIVDPSIQDLIDKGSITLQNAYALSQLSPTEQQEFKDLAITEESKTFLPMVRKAVKAAKDGKTSGAGPSEEFPGVVAHLRPLKEVQASVEDAQLMSLTAKEYAMWVISCDPESTAKAKAAWEARRDQRVEAARKRAVEAAQRKSTIAERAAERAAKSAAELAALVEGADKPVEVEALVEGADKPVEVEA